MVLYNPKFLKKSIQIIEIGSVSNLQTLKLYFIYVNNKINNDNTPAIVKLHSNIETIYMIY